jgi:hypothetical protein
VPSPESCLVSGNRNQSHQKGEREREREMCEVSANVECSLSCYMCLYEKEYTLCTELHHCFKAFQANGMLQFLSLGNLPHLMDEPVTGAKPNEAQKAAMTISHYQST